MKLSPLTVNAINITVLLADTTRGLTLAGIGGSLGLQISDTEYALSVLTSNNIVIKSGNMYRLASNPGVLRLYDIIEATEGGVSFLPDDEVNNEKVHDKLCVIQDIVDMWLKTITLLEFRSDRNSKNRKTAK